MNIHSGGTARRRFASLRFPKPQGTLWRVFGRLRPYRKKIALGALMIIVTQTLRMFLPLITRSVVNDVIPTRDFALMWKLGALLIALTAVRAVLLYARGIIFERVSQDTVYTLRTDLFARFQAQSHTFYDKHRIGEIMS
ncbi:MAG: hypothetical protein LBS72_03715, partial [Oscillospiraceae bacterium]|nr:hypothetical protein [Oscillospiraceae bacterium]